jgi:ABC-2 type transport system ATP-binding protein
MRPLFKVMGVAFHHPLFGAGSASAKEAERCQHIQLLHQGRVIAQGQPAQISGSFPRRILRLEAVDALRVRQLMKAFPSVVVHRFGHNLHLVCDEDQRAELQSALSAQGLCPEIQEPTLEDAFFHAVAHADLAA